MKLVQLDCTQMTSREEVHRLFAQALDFPQWYGNNLDALYDLLCEQPDTMLTLLHTSSLASLGSYGASVLETLQDAAKENPRLILMFD